MRICTLLLAIFCLCKVFGQNHTPAVRLHFEQGSYIINNIDELERLDAVVTTMQRDSLYPISKIELHCSASPEGGYPRNIELTHLRGESAKIHLVEDLGVDNSVIAITSNGIAWHELKEFINKEELRKALDNIAEPERHQAIYEIMSPEQYRDMETRLFPQLRYVDVLIYKTSPKNIAPSSTLLSRATLSTTRVLRRYTTSTLPQAQPLFAIKTNLLFDLATLINLEVEVPIKDRWSIAGEWIFPWWVNDNHQADSRRNRTQLLNANLEAKYWWGDRRSRSILTGWFTGIYTGGGIYDVERDAKGYQGDFMVIAGISGGYAHTINRAENLRLEYSLGVGYMETDYKYYHAQYCDNGYWHAVEQRSGRYRWFGPTKAKVSLSWLINCKSKKW